MQCTTQIFTCNNNCSHYRTHCLTMAQMRYPYTLGAMLMQFPLKFHIQKSWVWKSYAIGLVPTGLLFLKITNSFPEAEPAKSGH